MSIHPKHYYLLVFDFGGKKVSYFTRNDQKRVTMPMIEDAFADIPLSRVSPGQLISVSYLGFQTEEQFDGDKEEFDEIDSQLPIDFKDLN